MSLDIYDFSFITPGRLEVGGFHQWEMTISNDI